MLVLFAIVLERSLVFDGHISQFTREGIMFLHRYWCPSFFGVLTHT